MVSSEGPSLSRDFYRFRIIFPRQIVFRGQPNDSGCLPVGRNQSYERMSVAIKL